MQMISPSDSAVAIKVILPPGANSTLNVATCKLSSSSGKPLSLSSLSTKPVIHSLVK